MSSDDKKKNTATTAAPTDDAKPSSPEKVKVAGKVQGTGGPATVSPNDVLCGRGGATNHHVGNKQYRKVVADHQDEYIVSRKTEKITIAQKIVAIIQETGGRFLKQVDADTWEPIPDIKAISKTSQALREGQDVRNRAGGGSKKPKTKKPAAAKAGKVPRTAPRPGEEPKTKSEEKFLEDYTAPEVAAILDSKGPSFTSLSTTFREADVPGKLIADLLAEGDAALDKFLSDEAECTRKILRSSVVASFRLIPMRRQSLPPAVTGNPPTSPTKAATTTAPPVAVKEDPTVQSI